MLIHQPIHEYAAQVATGEYVLVAGGQPRQITPGGSNGLFKTVKASPRCVIYNPLFEVDSRMVRCPQWPGYRDGFRRTACWACPFQLPQQWAAMKRVYPDLHERMRELVQEIPWRVYAGDTRVMNFDRYWRGQGIEPVYDWGSREPYPGGPVLMSRRWNALNRTLKRKL
jgi:3'-phosphoadenosine 5'-phosphosulfate sulfotransferase (PAPS reductase)/FAD synthetase